MGFDEGALVLKWRFGFDLSATIRGSCYGPLWFILKCHWWRFIDQRLDASMQQRHQVDKASSQHRCQVDKSVESTRAP